MCKGRCLGLVGGLGVGATIHYYQKLAKAHEEQGRKLDIVIAHADPSVVFGCVQVGDRAGLAEYLTGFIRRLQAAGAEIAAIPAVTPHFCVRELIAMSPLPICNIFEPLIHELAARHIRRIAIFGTRFVMETALFGLMGDMEVVPASSDEMDYIHRAYLDLALQGRATEMQYQKLTALAHTLLQREGVETIVLAGTDLALLFNEDNTDFPHIDCAALHLAAIQHKLFYGS
jgi:aspartate racemase